MYSVRARATRLGAATFGLALLAWGAAASAAPPPTVTAAAENVEARASALEAQLMAPCCDHQTLDVHRSPPADAMRKEIRTRLTAGESEQEILSSFEQRYGPEIIAVQSLDEVNALGGTILLLSAVGAIGAGVTIRRWRRRSDRRQAEAAKNEGKGTEKADPEWDEQLDRELAALDD